ncbi:FAD-dependent monooxygenase [Actinoplanes sp. NPDC026623]|uniref:FAD-dependent monooxygenase n=1 Tax=Actinoplanes sp. NPDC026623 TaxID=3155610 RepID=UPI0033CE1E06
MSPVDVVIVGGGPTGLLLAGELRLGGVEVIVLERLAAPTGLSKAPGVAGRGAQTLNYRGLLDRFDGAALGWAKFTHFGGLPLDLTRLLESVSPEHLPPSLMAPQAQVERVLQEWAVELGAQLRRGHQVAGLTQTDELVTLQVDGPDCGYRLDSRYVVGCDGARSLVRRAAGIGFTGTEATQISRFGDVTLTDPDAVPPGMRRTPTGLFTAFPLGNGVHRVVVSEWRTDGDRDAPVALDDLRGAARRVLGAEVGMSAPRWLSRFTDAARQADRYRAGRVLLAGDAAHIQLPAGGPGMTTGLQDAANLGWKLAAQVRGDAPAGLLDTYHSERHPVAERMLTFVRAQGLLLSPGPQVDALRDVLAELLTEPTSLRTVADRLTGLDIHYQPGPHPLIGGWAPDLKLDRGTTLGALLHAGRPVLLDLTPDRRLLDAAAGWQDRVDLVPASADEPLTGLLVRPDGYVAWAHESGDDGLTQGLTTWFGPAG